MTTKEKREQARRMAVELDWLHARSYSLIADSDHDTIEAAVKALFWASQNEEIKTKRPA